LNPHHELVGRADAARAAFFRESGVAHLASGRRSRQRRISGSNIWSSSNFSRSGELRSVIKAPRICGAVKGTYAGGLQQVFQRYSLQRGFSDIGASNGGPRHQSAHGSSIDYSANARSVG
jgi:hypothetical protein